MLVKAAPTKLARSGESHRLCLYGVAHMQANIQLEFIRLLCQNEGVAVAAMSHPMRTLRRSNQKIVTVFISSS
ncbi:protein of unknown function (plasmid) [Caballeronia sp. S22]